MDGSLYCSNITHWFPSRADACIASRTNATIKFEVIAFIWFARGTCESQCLIFQRLLVLGKRCELFLLIFGFYGVKRLYYYFELPAVLSQNPPFLHLIESQIILYILSGILHRIIITYYRRYLFRLVGKGRYIKNNRGAFHGILSVLIEFFI